MVVRTFAVTKTPGEPGFLDELNAITGELAGVGDKVLRIDLRTYRAGTIDGKSRGIAHKLGVVPDFIWAIEDPPSTFAVPLRVTNIERDQWTNRIIRFIPTEADSTYNICVFALT